MYADDGTHFSRTRGGIQQAIHATSDFASATGVIIKPEKSYCYLTKNGPPITIRKYTSRGFEYSNMKELSKSVYYKHLGNVQNAEGGQTIKDIPLHDGSTHTGIYNKIKRHINTLLSRNITAAGTMQVLNLVLEKQITYPMQFANIPEKEIEKLQKLINKIIRAKVKIPRHITTETFFMHGTIGGLGETKIDDLININKLIILIQCLNGKGKMRIILQGALERLADYARISTCPLTTRCTHYTNRPKNMWLYEVKVWMEKHNFTLAKPNDDINHKQKHKIMDICTRKKEGKDIWEWTNNIHIKYITDIIHEDGSIRTQLLETLNEDIKSSIKGQLADWIQTNKHSKWPQHGKIRVGSYIQHKTTRHKGLVTQILTGKRKLQLQIYHKKRNGWHPTQRYQTCRIKSCTELKCTPSNSTPQIHLNDIILTQNSDTDSETDQPQEEEQHTTKPPPFMGQITAAPDMLQELTNLGFDENAVVEGVSDGSVKDISYRGTWAWALLYRDHRNLPQLWGIEAIGKDNVSKIEQTKCLDTSEIHSYRMEALGILAGLMFLRYAIEWKGKVIWHTDSQAVIDTYNGKLNHLTPGKWAVQRDKDIFDAMLYQKTWWKDRFQLEKVESHVDKKKDEYGNKRIPTPIEHMNIYADWLAESAYHQKIPIFNPRLLQRTDKWTIYKMVQGQQIELTDNWRKQIKEEIQICVNNRLWFFCGVLFLLIVLCLYTFVHQ